MNWNNIRGPVGEKIIEGLITCSSIKTVSMNNNLLGIVYDEKQAPVSRLAELLTHSTTIELVDVSYNFID